MDLIVHGPSPESELCGETHGKFTETFREFVKKGLQKDAEAIYGERNGGTRICQSA